MINFEEIASGIVKRSIATAACIDDMFAEPFGDENEKLDLGITKKLYSTFKENGCLLDINRYNEKYDSNIIEGIINNKDLLILDWELSESDPKYKNSLEILEQAVNKDNLPFVCIYTHKTKEDIGNEIIPQLDAYFSGIKEDNIKEIYENILEDLEDKFEIDAEEFFGELKLACFHECMKLNNEAVFNDIRRLIEKNDLGKKAFKEITNILKKYLESEELIIKDIVTLIKNIFIYTNNFYRYIGKSKYKVSYIEENALFIGTTLVVINSKEIEPKDLYLNLANTIIKRPSSIFSLLGLEMRTQYRSCALAIGKDMIDVDENAFLYFYNQIKDKEAFEELMRKIWNDKISFRLLAEESNFISLLEDKISKTKIDKFHESRNAKFHLAKLNAYFSQSNINRLNKKVRFGDIFEMNYDKDSENGHKEFLLCITPHCDCVRPSKIDNNFYFVKGEALNDNELNAALAKAEKDYYSFTTLDSKVLCIKWQYKMFTIHIKEKYNDIEKEISGYYKNEKIRLNHLNLQEENYTQRIANVASSDASRVGITLSQIVNYEEDNNEIVEKEIVEV